jgi:hypothetical protein
MVAGSVGRSPKGACSGAHHRAHVAHHRADRVSGGQPAGTSRTPPTSSAARRSTGIKAGWAPAQSRRGAGKIAGLCVEVTHGARPVGLGGTLGELIQRSNAQYRPVHASPQRHARIGRANPGIHQHHLVYQGRQPCVRDQVAPGQTGPYLRCGSGCRGVPGVELLDGGSP